MGYDFYLDEMLLPVPPSKMQMKVKNQNKTVVLINEGEVNLLKKAGLTDISFTVMLPQVRYPFAAYVNGFQRADFFLNKFESLKTSQKPFLFSISRMLPDGQLLFGVEMKVSLEDYRISEDVSNAFDVNVDINLKQYKDFSTKTIKITEQPNGNTATVQQARPADTAPQVKSYTVVKGDCLWNIAKRVYGNGSLFTKIAEANKDKVTNPNVIHEGTVLVIP